MKVERVRRGVKDEERKTRSERRGVKDEGRNEEERNDELTRARALYSLLSSLSLTPF